MKLKTGQKAAYGFGAFGKDVVYMLIATFLLNYYNRYLGMDSVFVGAVMMAARIFDAINDPFMGIVVGKTKTKWGKFRPWIFTGTVLNAITIYALFAAPAGNNPNSATMKIWLIVFYFAWGITYTLMDIPFWSMIPAITESGSDREQLSSLARSCAAIGGALPTVLTMMIVPILGGGSAVLNVTLGFKYWALIIAIVFIISEVICVFTVPEKPVDQEVPSVTIGEMFSSLFKNDQALTVVGAIICVYTSLNICGNLVLYFFQFDVGNEGGYTIFTGAAFIAQVIVMVLIPLLRKKVSKNQLFLAGFIAQIIGFVVILIMSFAGMYNSENWMILCIPGMLIYAGYGILNVIMTIFLSDSVDYGQVKNGTRDEAIIFSMQTFTVKLASGFAVFLAGLVIKWINLDITGAANTAAVLNGLRLWMTIPPIILLVCGMIIYILFYRLDDKKMEEINNQLKGNE